MDNNRPDGFSQQDWNRNMMEMVQDLLEQSQESQQPRHDSDCIIELAAVRAQVEELAARVPTGRRVAKPVPAPEPRQIDIGAVMKKMMAVLCVQVMSELT